MAYCLAGTKPLSETIGSYNGLLPGWHQAIIWNIAGILLIWPLGTNLNENLITIHTFSLYKLHLKMSSEKCQPFCLSLNVLIVLLGSTLLYNWLNQLDLANWEVLFRFTQLNPYCAKPLTCFQREHKTYIYILCHFSTLMQHRWLKSFLKLDKDLPILHR